MYCQSCGAQNVDQARFCNMCGVAIAPPGGPGGPIAGAPRSSATDTAPEVRAPAAPTGSVPGAAESSLPHPRGYQPTPTSGGSVSLQAIGVQSSTRTWTVIVVLAATLVALGGAGTWLMMRATDEETDPGPLAEVDPVSVPEEVEIGVPEHAVDAGTDVDFIAGGARVVSNPGAAEARPDSKAPPRNRPATQGGGGSVGRQQDSAGANQPGSGAAGDVGAEAPTAAEGGAGTASGEGAAPGDTPAGAPASGAVPDGMEMPVERDLTLELYGSGVRQFVRRFYANRVRSCFDRATRNEPNVRGTVVVAFTIGADGQVSQSRVTRNSTGNEELAGCLAGQVRTWQMPAPPGGELELEMPFSR